MKVTEDAGVAPHARVANGILLVDRYGAASDFGSQRVIFLIKLRSRSPILLSFAKAPKWVISPIVNRVGRNPLVNGSQMRNE